ncbi:MAG: phosphoglycerate dehydrogenase [Coriobacteriales bacterium]|jgi:D-3-phosphoglycerate dehydrogenase|nr:phosphoglycerate dehydrogenase [Coriobacteriales bacterium]
MKILVAEKIADKGIELLKASGHEVAVQLDLTPEELIAVIPAYEALIVRSATQASREVIEAGTNLKIIGRAGVGVDNVDVTAATERGIIVCNAPTSNVVSAAEQTITLLLASARRTPQANASMKDGKWDRGKFTGNELYQKTLAIFGLGRIGGLVAQRARAFEMRLIGYDPYSSAERAAELGVELYDKVEDILPQADFITVHLPKTKETIGMFGTEQFAAMKTGVYVVNTARGGIYDVDALAEAVKAGKVAGAGIDVYAKEPCTDSPLHALDQVILTPHLGASTKEAQARAGVQIAEFVLLGLEGKMVPTAVNVALVTDDVMTTVRPFIDAAQTAGMMLAQMADAPIEALTVRAQGDLANYDIGLLGTAALRGIFSYSSDDPVNFVNADHIAKQHGVEVSIEKDPIPSEYVSKVTFEVRTGGRTIEVSTTTSGLGGEARIISVLGYKLDLIPGKYVLIQKYVDKPGQFGLIGSLLGNANINISTLEVGVKGERPVDGDTGMALILMNVDEPVSAEVLAQIREAVGVKEGWFIQL